MPIIALGSFLFLKSCERNERNPQSSISELLILPESKLFNCKMVMIQRENHYDSHHWSKWGNYSGVLYPHPFLGALLGAQAGFVEMSFVRMMIIVQ